MLSGHFFATRKTAFRTARCRQCPVLSGHCLTPPFFYEIVKTAEKRQFFQFFAFFAKTKQAIENPRPLFEVNVDASASIKKKCAFREGLERVKLRKYRWRAPCIKKSHCGLWRGLPIKVLRDRSEPRSRQPPLV